MRGVEDLATLDCDYDAVMGLGSLMHAPPDVMKPEFDELVARLKPEGGRFIMHSYPKRRWEREGCLPFDKWGAKTDGEGTPWAEWYDPDKLITALKPARFELVYYCEYRQGDMNCIDLARSRAPECVLPRDATLLACADLTQAATYWEGTSLQSTPNSLNVTTGSLCWGYAAEVPLAFAQNRIPSARRYWLTVKASVEQGEIGVGILQQDGKRFLAELRIDAQSDAEQVSAEIEDIENSRAVIIRNSCRDNQPSKDLIQEISLYCC